MRSRIPLDAVREKYNALDKIWLEDDYWHFHMHERFKEILCVNKQQIERSICLNIGSAAESYGISTSDMVYFDAAERSLPRNKLSACGDAHALPFARETFGSVIAVGSVINYCSPAEFILEVSRVLKEGGYFLFDFEQSEAYEHFGTAARGARAHMFNTDFNGYDETIWVYSQRYIRSILRQFALTEIRRYSIHTISSMVWRLTYSNNITSAFCNVDHIASRIPFLKNYSSTVFIVAQKSSA